jgi:hypothetical protein
MEVGWTPKAGSCDTKASQMTGQKSILGESECGFESGRMEFTCPNLCGARPNKPSCARGQLPERCSTISVHGATPSRPRGQLRPLSSGDRDHVWPAQPLQRHPCSSSLSDVRDHVLPAQPLQKQPPEDGQDRASLPEQPPLLPPSDDRVRVWPASPFATVMLPSRKFVSTIGRAHPA